LRVALTPTGVWVAFPANDVRLTFRNTSPVKPPRLAMVIVEKLEFEGWTLRKVGVAEREKSGVDGVLLKMAV